jgi:hypothetical protein
MFDIFTLEINYQVLHSLQIRAEKLKKIRPTKVSLVRVKFN